MRQSGCATVLSLSLLSACGAYGGDNGSYGGGGSASGGYDSGWSGGSSGGGGSSSGSSGGSGDTSSGAALYASYCSSCHGSDASGGYGPALAGISDSNAVIDMILYGGDGMPGFSSSLSDQDIADILAYLGSLGGGSSGGSSGGGGASGGGGGDEGEGEDDD